MRNHHSKSDDSHMTKTRTLLIAAALTLAGTLTTTAPANAGPVPCTTKRCVPPAPRTCVSIQAEIADLTVQLAGPTPTGHGFWYDDRAMLQGWLTYVSATHAAAEVAYKAAEAQVAYLLANAPASIEGGQVGSSTSSFGVLTLDRYAIWLQQLDAAQAELNLRANVVMERFNSMQTLIANLAYLDSMISQAEAHLTTLQSVLKTCAA
jgi:hypothetical protein